MVVFILFVAIVVAIVFLKMRYANRLGTDAGSGGAWYFGQFEDRAKMEARRRAAARKTFCNDPLHDHIMRDHTMHVRTTEIGINDYQYETRVEQELGLGGRARLFEGGSGSYISDDD